MAWNLRAQQSGLLARAGNAQEQLKQLLGQPETERSAPIPLPALTPDSLRATMQTAVLAIGRRRWSIGSALPTPNAPAFAEMLKSRYGYATDDVEHRDLLSDALDADGTLLPLLED